MPKKSEAPTEGEQPQQPTADPQGNPPPKVRTAEEEAAKAARKLAREQAKAEAAGQPAPVKPAEPARIPPHKSLVAAVEAVIKDIQKRPCTEKLQLALRKLEAAIARLNEDAEAKPEKEEKPLKW